VLARVNLMRGQLNAVKGIDGWEVVAPSVDKHLDEAVKAADHPGRGLGIRDAWSGARIDAAWANLHNAELLFVSVAPREDLTAGRHAVVALVEQTLAPDDIRRTEARRQLVEEWGTCKPADPHDRAAYRTALQWGFGAADEQYARVRSLRNLILASAALMLLLAIALAVLGAVRPTVLSMCFENVTSALGETTSCPTRRDQPTGGDIALVEFLGLLGGALSAMVAIRGMRGTSTPYAIPVALALLKLPAGALVSISALMLLHGEFFPGLSGLDSPGQIAAYAIVLGYAQQLVTRLVDRQANSVLDRVPSADPAPSPVPAPNTPNTNTPTTPVPAQGTPADLS
jgi:hypothetical protein